MHDQPSLRRVRQRQTSRHPGKDRHVQAVEIGGVAYVLETEAPHAKHRALRIVGVGYVGDGEIKLSDLGRARGPHDTAPLPPFTDEAARYASPELLADSAQPPDLRADIYSLGVMLFETITGRLPVAGAPIPPEALPADCPPALAQLLAALKSLNLRLRTLDVGL